MNLNLDTLDLRGCYENEVFKYIKTLYPNVIEQWKEVDKLNKFNSKHEIIDIFHFEKSEYFVSNLGRFIHNGNIVNIKLDTYHGYITHTLYSIDKRKQRFKRNQIVCQLFKNDEFKELCSTDHINRKQIWNNSIYNLRWGDAKLQAHNRENKEYKYKKVICINNLTIYNSCQEAEIALNISKNMVSRIARGERKHVHGYKFIYATETNQKYIDELIIKRIENTQGGGIGD